MSAGQSLLAVGAILLLMNVTLNLNRSYVSALSDTFSHQIDIEAIQFGQALSENLFSAGRDYESLQHFFDNYDDVTQPQSRIPFMTAFGDSLFATIEFSAEQTLLHNVSGRKATITIYSRENNDYIARAQNIVTVNPL